MYQKLATTTKIRKEFEFVLCRRVNPFRRWQKRRRRWWWRTIILLWNTTYSIVTNGFSSSTKRSINEIQAILFFWQPLVCRLKTVSLIDTSTTNSLIGYSFYLIVFNGKLLWNIFFKKSSQMTFPLINRRNLSFSNRFAFFWHFYLDFVSNNFLLLVATKH